MKIRFSRRICGPKSRWILGFLPCLSAVLLCAGTAQAAPTVPRGVFSIANVSKQPQNSVLINPDVVGISLRQSWSELEPTEGNFDWSYLDLAVANCTTNGKQVLIRIGTQSSKPAWVTTAVQQAGGTFFTFDDDGVQTTIPVFWDPTFLAKKKAMIAALGAHFTNNPVVKIVVASFANSTSEDWSVPHGPTDVDNWLAAGYTSEKVLDAGKQIIDATMIAFPNQVVTLAVNGSGRTVLDPSSDYVARTAVGRARSDWPGRLNVQKNDLSANNPVAPGTDTNYGMIWDFQPDVGGQMVFQCVNDPGYRANGGVPADPAVTLQKSVDNALSYREKFIEIYQVDVMALPIVITYAHDALLESPPPPTPTPTPTPVRPVPPTGLRVNP